MLDTGILCHLLGLDENRLTSDTLMNGAVLETFVVTELWKQLTWSSTKPQIYHFRTHQQQEVDVVLEGRDGCTVGIEIKKTASPSTSDFNGLRKLKELAGSRFRRGILLCLTRSHAPFGPDFSAVPISALWESGDATTSVKRTTTRADAARGRSRRA